MRRRRLVRWLGVAAVLVIGLYFVGDIVALQYMQSRGGAEIARTMTAESAKVKLGSVPFLPGFFTGRISNVSASVTGATGDGGFGVQSVDFRASKVTFKSGAIFSLARSIFSTRTKVTFTDPLVIVQIGEGDLRDFIKHAMPSVGDVQIKGSGIEVRFKLPQPDTTSSSTSPEPSPTPTPNPDDLLSKPARYLPRIEDRHLVLTLTSASQINFDLQADAARIEHLIRLPAVPPTMNSDVKLGKGVIQIESTGRTLTLEVGEGPT